MTHASIGSLAFVGNYVPRTCGLATFTRDLYYAIRGHARSTECFVVGVRNGTEPGPFPPEVRFSIDEQDIDSYRRAADYLNLVKAEAVCLQHEFGIYGGESGSHILELIHRLRMPVVTTLHTIVEEPLPAQRQVVEALGEASARLIVMAEKGRDMLHDIYGIAREQVEVIPHGIPDMPFIDPNFYKDIFGLAGQKTLLTFGLLSPNKGIETVIRALPAIIEQEPELRYVVVGATHPNLLRTEGESYRESLQELARELGVAEHVRWHNRFVELAELLKLIGSADLYVTPYRNREQITSGTLSYAFGCGKAVLSTPYWHAEELLADGRGVLFPFDDDARLAASVCHLLSHDEERHAMRKRAYMHGRHMVWSEVADAYVKALQAPHAPAHPVVLNLPANLNGQLPRLPTINLDHLLAMTDDTGLTQHAVYDLPRFAEGYCVDDNARGLLLGVLLQDLGLETPAMHRACQRYAAFLDYAFTDQRKAFRNFMLYDRKWRHEVGSDDCQGRALLALGAVVGRSRHEAWRAWAQEIFCKCLPTVMECSSPRSWAYALLGIHEYFRRLSGDRLAENARETLSQRLLDLYHACSTDGWRWFEDRITYGNAVLPHAMLLSGHWAGNQQAMEVGLESLGWLMEVQTGSNGCMRPIGSEGFYQRGGEAAVYDQQPIEAHVTVSACLEAFGATGDDRWRQEAWRAFTWFLGRNDLGESLVDEATGGCADALHRERLNGNQGAESTLAWLLSLTNMRLFQRSHETAIITSAASAPAAEPTAPSPFIESHA